MYRVRSPAYPIPVRMRISASTRNFTTFTHRPHHFNGDLPSAQPAKMSGKLIDVVKAYPGLYDPNSALFGLAKKKAWAEVANKLGLASGAVAKAKWRNARDSYIKYLKAIDPTISEAEKVSRSKHKNWPWAKKMRFLLPFTNKTSALTGNSHRALSKSRTEIKDVKVEQDLEGTEPQFSEDSDIPETDPFSNDYDRSAGEELPNYTNTNHAVEDPNKLASHVFIKTEENPVEVVLEERQCSTSSEEITIKGMDATDLLFLSYARTLKTFPAVQQIELKTQIGHIISAAEVERINNSNSS